jgi:hypothetical protein
LVFSPVGATVSGRLSADRQARRVKTSVNFNFAGCRDDIPYKINPKTTPARRQAGQKFLSDCHTSIKIYLDKATNIRYNIIVEKTKGTPQSGYAQIAIVIANIWNVGRLLYVCR